MGHGFHNEVVPDATYPPSTPQGVLALEPCKSSGAGDGDFFAMFRTFFDGKTMRKWDINGYYTYILYVRILYYYIILHYIILYYIYTYIYMGNS